MVYTRRMAVKIATSGIHDMFGMSAPETGIDYPYLVRVSDIPEDVIEHALKGGKISAVVSYGGALPYYLGMQDWQIEAETRLASEQAKCPKCGTSAVIREFWSMHWDPEATEAVFGCGSRILKDGTFIRGGLGDTSCYAVELSAAHTRIAELEDEAKGYARLALPYMWHTNECHHHCGHDCTCGFERAKKVLRAAMEVAS